MLIIPYQADVPMRRWPIANFVIIGITILFFFFQVSTNNEHELIDRLVLDGWNLGLVGSVLLHGDILHLLGNMVFLWVFGNAICAKLGNGVYPLVYVGLAVAASSAHNIFDGGLAIGASGAINGIVGMFLIWYPLNHISCLWFFFYRGGSFDCSSIWMILLWFAFDIWGATAGGGGVAYMAHIGGLAAGASLAVVLLKTRLVEMESAECSIFDMISGGQTPEHRDERPEPSQPPAAKRPRSRPRDTAPLPLEGPPAGERVLIAANCDCGRVIRVSSNLAGRHVRCPICAEPVEVPNV